MVKKLMHQHNTKSISVKLHASLGQYKPIDADSLTFDMKISEEMTVLELLVHLSIPNEIIKMISLNDKLVKSTATLSDGDRLILFSTIAGG